MEALRAAAKDAVKAVFGFFGSKPPEAIPHELVVLQTSKDKADGLAENGVTGAFVDHTGVSIMSPSCAISVANNKLEENLNKARGNEILTPKEIEEIRTSGGDTTMPVVQVDPASIEQTNIVANIARKGNNQLDINLENVNNAFEDSLVPFEQEIERIYDDKAAVELKALRGKLEGAKITTDNFRTECVETAVTELSATLAQMYGVANIPPDVCSVMRQIAESWSPYLSCPENASDVTVDRNNQIFFTRTSQAIDALCSRCVFFSRNWLSMPSEHIAPLPPPPPPPPPPHPAPAPAPHVYNNDESYYPKVSIGQYRYVIGPILDFQNIQGRIFIYIKCYSDDNYTKGTYFWVYRSQSEGLFRVFFKVDPSGSIEKGYDYTQATLVHFRLQILLCIYYERHNRRGELHPIVLNTLGRLNYFMKNMNRLQAGDFLDNFPQQFIIPSYYSRYTNGVARPGVHYIGESICAKDVVVTGGNECCYVCLTQSYVPRPPLQSLGMIGHYYVIDAKFASIISRGFPIGPGPPDPEGDKLWYDPRANPQANAEWSAELRENFPTDPHETTHQHYDFSRRKHGYQRTHPYICCFTTCCMVQPCSSFVDFLHINKYKNTFWCQGFENYTAKLSVDLPREILSPVLYVLIGALLQDSDMTLLTLRNNILNSPIPTGHAAMQKSTEYNRATTALMTLGTRYEDLDTMTTLYLPGIPDYIREAALMAFRSIRDQNDEAYKSFKTQMRVSTMNEYRERQKRVVIGGVQKKINMVKCLAYFASVQYATGRLTEKQQRLFELFKKEKGTLMRTQVSWPATVSEHALVTHANSVATFLHYRYTAAVATATAAAADATDFVKGCNSAGVFNPGRPATEVADDSFKHDDLPSFIEALQSAFNFINASPCAAAAALFGYILNPLEYENYLIDYALLCLKKGWISGMIDDAYRALEGVYDTERRIYNYLGEDGVFHEFFRTGDVPVPVPAPRPHGAVRQYLFKSSFDETRKKDTSRENPDPNELNVTVVTFANIYRMDCYYNSFELIPQLKCMSMLYQFSSTIVYTRELNPQILYAIDNQRTPLASIPDLPDALPSTGTGQGGGAGKKKSATAAAATGAATGAAAAAPGAAAAAAPAKLGAAPAKLGAAQGAIGQNTAAKVATSAAAAAAAAAVAVSKQQQQLQQLQEQQLQQLREQIIHYLTNLRDEIGKVPVNPQGLDYSYLQTRLNAVEYLASTQYEQLNKLGDQTIQIILQQVPVDKKTLLDKTHQELKEQIQEQLLLFKQSQQELIASHPLLELQQLLNQYQNYEQQFLHNLRERIQSVPQEFTVQQLQTNLTIIEELALHQIDQLNQLAHVYIEKKIRQEKLRPELGQVSEEIIKKREEKLIQHQLLLFKQSQQELIASHPLLPETKKLLYSHYTMCATYSRICSAGGLIVGKGMEYFFEVDAQRGYYQLPFFFKYFGKFLSVCHQYYTTALIYSCNIPPYNLLLPFQNTSFLPHIAHYFIDLKIFLKNDNGNVFTPAQSHEQSREQLEYIAQKLAQNTADINAIRDWLTGEFMVDPNELDDSSDVTGTPSASPESSQSSQSSQSSFVSSAAAAPATPTLSRTRSALSRTRSATSMSSQVSQGYRMRKNCNKLNKLIQKNEDIAEAITRNDLTSNQLAYYLCIHLDSCGSGRSWSGSQGSQKLGTPTSSQGSQVSPGGGSLLLKRAIKKSITTRKNKNKNRTKSKPPFRRGTFRIKRMIKSKLTRNKTCKRRAPNVKHKNNKTMRRYRRVRK